MLHHAHFDVKGGKATFAALYTNVNLAGHIAMWWLIDVNAFRAGLIRQASNGHSIHCGDKQNQDGTWFKWFDIRAFPAEPRLVIACSGIVG
jgi:hypothetical protein